MKFPKILFQESQIQDNANVPTVGTQKGSRKMIQKYGTVIKEERLRQGISLDVLANILLLDSDAVEQVEKGQVELSDFRLNICANIFHLSKDSLMVGVRQVAISDLELRQELEKITQQLSDLMKTEKNLIKNNESDEDHIAFVDETDKQPKMY